MLIFRKCAWIDMEMPEYVDPSWGFGDRLKAATIIYDSMENGSSFEEAWGIAEREIYVLLGVLRKEHSPPENEKKEASVKEEAHR
jgi:hypothetical protein